LVINCLLLILLVLVQLPKKDAGAGLAFGGGAADALFGAGSGNVLTKVTKWATVAFLGLAIILGYMENSLHNQNSGVEFQKAVQQAQQTGTPMNTAPAPAPTPHPAVTPTVSSNSIPLLLTPTTMTNTPAVPAPAK
jgi:preprotein translocase subunit SecG